MRAADAYAYARTRARRSTLLRPEQLDSLVAATTRRELVSALRAANIDAGDPDGARSACLARFAADAAALIASWSRPALLRAIVGLEEIENLKLACRALRRGLEAGQWVPLWRPLGAVARLAPEAFAGGVSLRAALDALPDEPYGEGARRALRAHEGDPAGFEIALDSMASLELLAAGAASAADARRLAEAEVRIRDLDALCRSAARGLRPEDAAAATVLLRREWKPEVLQAVARGQLPEALRRRWPSAATPAALAASMREALRAACLRTFIVTPFRPASAAALLLLRRDEMRSVISAVEARFNAGGS
ncbi:MAG: V-type ATPase subunit [Deltaproteobacteria bacterium]